MNCKLEAEVVNLQTEYFTSSSKTKTENQENEKLVLQLHEAQVSENSFSRDQKKLKLNI
jgi:hypothetical protein